MIISLIAYAIYILVGGTACKMLFPDIEQPYKFVALAPLLFVLEMFYNFWDWFWDKMGKDYDGN